MRCWLKHMPRELLWPLHLTTVAMTILKIGTGRILWSVLECLQMDKDKLRSVTSACHRQNWSASLTASKILTCSHRAGDS